MPAYYGGLAGIYFDLAHAADDSASAEGVYALVSDYDYNPASPSCEGKKVPALQICPFSDRL